ARAMGAEYVIRRPVRATAPEDADGRGDVLGVAPVIELVGAVAGNAGRVAEAFRSEDGVGAAIAEAHRHGAAVELRHFAEPRQRIGHIGLALFDLFEPRLRT